MTGCPRPGAKGFNELELSLALWRVESSWFSAQASGRPGMLKETKSQTQAFFRKWTLHPKTLERRAPGPPTPTGVGISFPTRGMCWRRRNSWEWCLLGTPRQLTLCFLLPVQSGRPFRIVSQHTRFTPCPSVSLRLLSQTALFSALVLCGEESATGLPSYAFPGLSPSYSQSASIQRRLHYPIST